ncbi:GH92 family glycosyl hydrolase [Actinacidiphila acididurans]|uniref:GH92 family glycosyl hydrolase n=1 Tax=Actinacidiphila acididurans TaxID=2784346 RepID=A0ABS2TZB2_9ACTN|nr:GH92 family glycosyl hydrolase [Actinacidiphila acididurans]MBM9507650.1 GH92 family glycosyl hydrolase [Actinacidiphila acididurans]
MRNGPARIVLARSLLATAVALVLTVPGSALANAASDGSGGGAPDFSTSFESGDAQPTWTSTAENDDQGNPMISGVTAGTVPVLPGSVKDKISQVTANSDNPPNETAAKAADEDPGSKWLTFATSGWLEYALTEDVTVKKYALTSANDFPDRDPKDFALQGSADGSTWTDLDSRAGQSFSGRFRSNVYDVADPGAYRYYRLNITANSGNTGSTQLADLILSDGSPAPTPVAGMTTDVGSGPGSGPNVKPSTGFTGLKALEYAGTHTRAGAVHAWNKLYDVHIPVTADTQLSYDIFPELTGADLKYPSTYAAIDLHFTDGTYLSSLAHPAVDQNGIALTPKDQGSSKILYASQWNRVVSRLGQVAAGRTVDRILLGYDDPNGSADPGNTTQFKGWVDDISLGPVPAAKPLSSYAQYADTRRGTNSSGSFSRGNNMPLTAVPNGFNFYTPVTDAGSASWEYSYAAQNNADNLPTLQALGISHEPSPWMGDRDLFQVMPSTATGTPSLDRAKRALPFRHSDEVAQPHYYGVTFTDGLKAEIAPADHSAIFRFTFPGDTGDLLFDNVSNAGGLTLDAAHGTLDGYADYRSGLSAGASRMYVHAEFDRTPATATKVTGAGRDNVTGYAQFDTSADRTVTMRVATSFISADQARANLTQEIPAGTSFDAVKDSAQRQWNSRLGKVEVQGATPDQLTTLYSDLYRMNLYPNSGYENTGTTEHPVYQYASPFATAGTSTPTQTGAKIVDGKVYVNNGFWDTYRTEWPAYSLLESKKAGELADGFVQQYKDGGWTARWSSPGYADLMTGTSSDVAFADAYAKGVTGFDAKAAYEAAVKNATVVPPASGVGRKGLATSEFTGYTDTGTDGSVSWSLDGYVNDYGIGTMAAKLAKDPKTPAADRERYQEESAYFLGRARDYVTLFNKGVGFFEGRKADGSWRVPDAQFDPQTWGYEYTESNAWNYAFTVPQDPAGLAAVYGGQKALEGKLDTFFGTQETADGDAGSYGGTIHEMIEARDVRMGELGISNQPSFGIPYMYDYAGAPAKTQAAVREIERRLFTGSSIGQGYPGDEDNGATSTWQIFSALGFYPLQVGSDNYVIGSPLFTRAVVHLDNGKDIVVNAPDNNGKNVYVQSLKVNGEDWDKVYLTQKQLSQGARLDFTMGPKPSDWGSGKNALPTSLTPAGRQPQALADTTGPGQGTATAGDSTDVSTLFDNTSATRVTFPTATPQIRYDYAQGGKKVTFYTLTSGTTAGQDPAGWQLQGSTDGTHWTTLDTRAGQTFTDRLQTRPFQVAHPGTYTSYRLVVTAGGSQATSLAEVELLN